MKLGSCIHLEELRSTLRSILRLDLLFTALVFCFFGGFRCGVPLFIVMLVIY